MENLKRSILLYGLILVGSAVEGWCVPGINPDGSLNREVVSKFYFDGDFDAVTNALEFFRKDQQNISTDDQIFMYKYLSVVYASNPDTKDKGESYMYQLLKLVPTIDLLDMYISDSIESIFNRVKDRYKKMEEKGLVSEAPPADASEQVPQETMPAKENGNDHGKTKKIVMWTLGGAALAGIVTYFALAGNDESPEVMEVSNYK